MTDSPPQPPYAGQRGGDGAPTHQLTFSLLGRVQILRGGRPVELRGRKPWAVLAMLLLHPNHVVSCERLKEGLWGSHRPKSATNTLQAFVSRARSALGEHGGTPGGQQVLETAPGGYLIRVDPDQVDLHRFERLLREGSGAYAETDYARAQELLDQSLALWKGEALLGVSEEPFARVEAPRMDELRLAAEELRLAARLETGEGANLVPELESMVARDPGRERPAELLMIALYRAGRQSDALAVFDSHRRGLVEATGLEPGPGLHDLQRRILTHDPALIPMTPLPPPSSSTVGGRRWTTGWRRVATGFVLAGGAILAATAGWILADHAHPLQGAPT